MAKLGHADPKMTLGVYAKVMMSGDSERNSLGTLVEGGLSPVAARDSYEVVGA